MRKMSSILVLAILALTIVSCSPVTEQAATVTQIDEEGTVSTEPAPEVIGATDTAIPPTEMPTATATQLVSVDGGLSATLSLTNMSDRNVLVYWIDQQGQEQQVKRLAPNQFYDQDALVGYAYRIKDEATGQILSEIIVDRREVKEMILVNADLGPTLVPTQTPKAVLVDGPSGCQVVESGRSLLGKMCNEGGIQILAAEEVRDQALEQAWLIITNMLASRPDLKEHLVNVGAQFVIIGANQETADLYHSLSLGDAEFWNDRARGFGGSKQSPVTSAAEENLLCWSSDDWHGYHVGVHEFAHTIHLVGLESVEPDFDSRLAQIFQAAKEAGKWANAYAGTNREEYWAEGVTMYFSAFGWNLAENEYVNSREELKEYDPELYNLIDETFRGLEWAPGCP
jgi:hypothetical protein